MIITDRERNEWKGNEKQVKRRAQMAAIPNAYTFHYVLRFEKRNDIL